MKKNTQATLKRNLDCIEVEENLWVYKVSFDVAFNSKELPDNFKQAFSLPTYQGVARTSDLEAFKAGTSPRINNIAKMVVGDPMFREHARTEGFMEAWEAHDKTLKSNTDIVYDLFLTGNIEADDLIIMEVGSHSLFHRDGTPLPVAVYFDYINGNMSNGVYDLSKALQHLKTLPSVVVIPDKKGNLIHEVPYFNSSSSCSNSLVFKFMPTREDFLTLWPTMQRLHKEYPGIMIKEAMFENDTLGLRAVGATKYPTYYGSDANITSYDDNDHDL